MWSVRTQLAADGVAAEVFDKAAFTVLSAMTETSTFTTTQAAIVAELRTTAGEAARPPAVLVGSTVTIAGELCCRTEGDVRGSDPSSVYQMLAPADPAEIDTEIMDV